MGDLSSQVLKTRDASVSALKTSLRSKMFLIGFISFLLLIIAWLLDINFDNKGVDLLTEALKTMGATGIAVVSLNFWIESEDWVEYIKARLRSIVIEQNYMEGLDLNMLENVLLNVMRARFKGAIVDAKGGFLEHFNRNIIQYIASPFREDVSTILTYQEADSDHWLVTDRVEYTCRRVGEKAQNFVRWSAKEASEVKSLVAYVMMLDADEKWNKIFLGSYPENASILPSLEEGISLDNFNKTDGFRVGVEATYIQSKSRYSSWSMIVPTRDAEVTLIFPAQYIVVYDTMVTKEGHVQLNKGSTHCKLTYKGWMLPENGIVWQLHPAGPQAELLRQPLLTHPSSTPQ